MQARVGSQSRFAWPIVVAIAAALLFAAYFEQSTRGTYVNSDGASNALQAWDMLHGNLLLHGWTMSDVSFYTTELPQYMLIEVVRGLRPDVVHIAAAMTYTLLVLLAGWLAKGRATGAEGIARVLTASGIMLAPQLGNPTAVLLLSPDHVGTGVPLLLTWLVIDRADPNGRPWAAAVAGLLLAWTAVGDPLVAVVGALPLLEVCAIRAYRVVVVRGEPPRNCRYELSLGAAALLSVAVAAMVTRLIAADGGWTQSAVRTRFATADVLPHNVMLTWQGLLQLYGADFTGQPVNRLAIFAVLHLAGAGLVGWALWLAVRRLFAAELLVQVLTVAIGVNLAAYLFTVQPQNITSTREIAAVLPYGAVLAGRLVADRLLALRLAPAMAVLLVCYGGMLVSDAAQPQLQAQTSSLTAWLAGHHLTQGLAGYWQANVVTLDSRDAVQVRAVAVNAGALEGQGYWEASKSWYNPASHYADFLVSAGSAASWQDQLLMRTMAATAGEPARVYQFGPYTIAVWHQNLLSRLH